MNTKKLQLFVIVIFLLLLAGRAYFLIYEDNKLDQKLSKEYKTLKTTTAINNEIISSYFPPEWRGGDYYQYITFDNGEKYSIYIIENLDNKDVFFGQLVRPGIRIFKRAGTDTLKVIMASGDEYRFLTSEER